MVTSISDGDPQTYWKRIKVPPALVAAGWKLEKRDSSAPFALVNKKLDQETGGYPDPQEAIEAARGLQVEAEEAAAIAAEGNGDAGDQERPEKLPVALVDEGWRLHKIKRLDGFEYRADRGLLSTDYFAAPADAVARAIKLEAERQAEVERRELEFANGPEMSAALTEGAPNIAENPTSDEGGKIGNGHDAPPAELLLELDRIRLDGGTQQRSLFDPAVVENYVEMMEHEEFPPVDVFFDGSTYWLADGFYRVRAHQQLDRTAIQAHIRAGSQRDAILYSLGANARHGLPRSPEDKRRAVLVMLRDPEWAGWSDAVLAERVRVSIPFVRKLRRQEEAAAKTNAAAGEHDAPETTQPTKRRGRDGRVQETKRIGTPSKRAKAAQLPLAAAPVLCSDCPKELAAGDYRDDLGRCWDCAGMDQKKPRGKKAEEASGTSEAPPVRAGNFAELGAALGLKARPPIAELVTDRLFISFTWEPGRHHHVAATVALGIVGSSSIRIPSRLVWPFLPDKVFALIERAAKAVDQTTKPPAAKPARLARAPKASTKASTKKTKTSKAPARKPTAKKSKRAIASAWRTKSKVSKRANKISAKLTRAKAAKAVLKRRQK